MLVPLRDYVLVLKQKKKEINNSSSARIVRLVKP